MAEDYYDLPINKHTDWGGDSSTNNKPVTGKQVQAFVKDTLEQKIGEMYFDATRNRYLVFSDAENRDAYLKDPIGNANLLIGSFEAPFNYQAKITLKSPAYNAITLGSSGNYIEFSVDVENKEGYSTGENILCTYTIRRGSITTSISEQYSAGKEVRFNVDSFLDEGVNNITIAIQGTTSLAATTIAVTYQVVNLKLTTDLDISQIYDLSESEQTMSVPFSVSGYGTKVVEWYIDGVQLDFVKIEDEVVEVEVARTKYITLSNLSQGTHNLQIRAYVIIEGERFYSDVLYREFMVYTGINQNTMFAIAMSVPSKYGVISERKLYSLVQYVPYELVFATYTPTVKASCDVLVKLNNIEQGTIHSENGIVNKITIASTTSGYGLLSLSADGQVYETEAEIAETTMAIEEITDQLTLAFSALGKTNNATDKDKWSYGSYKGTFSGFNWNETSGWVDNALYINNGASFAIDYAPLANNPTQLGKTIELEFCTTNVSDDNAIICDLRNDNGAGIVITATSVKMVSDGGMVVETSYKANEYVRFGFVINKSANTTNKCMSFIYDKGIVSRGVAWLPTDKYTSDKTILFSGSEKAEVKLKNIRVYDSALTNDQMLNNYMLYRDSVLEMNAIYERNDVYEEGTTSFNYERMIGRLPVMIITGDIPSLEATTDKDKQIVVDIDYFNIQDPELSFSMTNAALRPQGTSSMGYPKKNFRPYTQKIDKTKLYDYKGNEVKDKLYAFKKGSQRVNCWCLKADYAESSGTHNTGIARLWNDILFNATINGEYVFRTMAQKKALESEYKYDVRTTIDGFPILLFYRMTKTSPLTFIGKYNFNNDKSTESVFGFKNIPNFDNSRMQCWEVLNNGNPLALFTSVEGFDSNWSEAFESRYPDTKTPNTSDLKAFCTWMTNVSANNFATQKWEHLDVYKVAAYYVYLMRFGAVDQTVKNSMLTSEDGSRFYFINYDNDTINGLINTGRLLTPWYATRETLGEDGQPYYAGNESRLWNLLEQDSEFMSIVRSVDEALYSAGLTYENVINIFDNEQADKWVERVYNQDAQYKYISPYADSGIDNLFMLQGKRITHRKYWLAKRFSLFDSKFITGDYKAQSIELKCINNTPSGQKFTITAGTNMDYGYGINNVAREGNIALNENQTHTFTTQEVVNLGDPIRIYTAPNIKGLDLSQMSDVLAVVTIDKVYNEELGTKLKTLIVGSDTKENVGVETISGLAMAKELEYIDVQNMKGMKALDLSQQKNIKYVDARGSNISAIELSAGAPIETLKVPSVMKVLNFNQLPNLASIGAEDWGAIQSITILKCPKLSINNYQFLVSWALSASNKEELYLEMNDILWENISYTQLATIGNIGTKKLKGRVKLSDTSITSAQVETLTRLFGSNCLNPNSEFYIDVPEGVFIIGGADSIIEGDSLQFSTQVVSNYSGSVTWSITSGGTTNQSISSNGLLTTKEVGSARSITIQAKFTPTSGSAVIATKTISVVKAIRPTSATISGANQLVGDTTYTLAINPTSGINREYSVDWTLENNGSNYVIIKSETKTNCVLALNSTSAVGSVTLKATITCDNGTKVTDTHTINLGVNLTMQLLSNQSGDSTITNSGQATIKYDSVTLTAKHNGVVNVPINKAISVTFNSVSGYKTPSALSFTTATSALTKSATYQTEIVKVTLTTSDGSSANGTTIVINGTTHTWNGSTISQKVAFGVEYSVAITPTDSFFSVATETFVAQLTTRTISKTLTKAVRPTSAVISGESDIWLASSRDYVLTISPSEVNTTYSVAWSLSGSASPYLSVTNTTNNSCKVQVTDRANCTGDLTLTATITTDKGTKVTATKSIKVDTQIELYTASNQTADNNDTWKKQHTITLKYGSKTITAKHGDILPIPITSYTISYSDFEGYKKPDNISDSIKSGAGASIKGTYKTEVVSVNITADEGDVSGVIFFINKNEYTWNNSPIIVKIPFGTTCDIVFSDLEGYKTPISQSFTSNSVSRSISVEYKIKVIPNGVFIADVSGNYYTTTEWNTDNNSNAMGVLVGDGTHCFIIGKEDIGAYKWGPDTTVSGVLESTDYNALRADMDGFGNTAKIIQSVGNTYAAGQCAKYTFINGKNGYLGSVGEWNLAWNNRIEVNNCMSACGGTSLTSSWVSNAFTYKRSMYFNFQNTSLGSTLIGYDKKNSYKSRPFCVFE